MSSNQDWYQNGRSGSDAPSSSDQNKSFDAHERWAEGYQQKRRDERTDYIVTHPDDPFCTKKDQYY